MMNSINSFLWLCAGANKSLIKRCPTDGAKYAGIGATIIFTGLLAALAATYASYTIFDNVWTSVLFGCIWGIMIFNLDRYVVSSMKKQNNQKKEFLTALPRIVLALLIAIVISKPLELKIFNKEIAAELILMEQEVYRNQEESIAARFNNDINELQLEIENLKNEIMSSKAKKDTLIDLARQEADGTGGSLKRNPGPIYKIKKENADKAENELQELIKINQPLIDEKTNSIMALRQNISSEKLQLEYANYDGFAARMDALSRIKEKSSAIQLADWFIFLLFIALETAPIFVKLISTKGPYDELLEAHEHQYKMRNVDLIANQSNTTRTENEHLSTNEKVFLNEKLSGYLN